jgi:hypothetical protein
VRGNVIELKIERKIERTGRPGRRGKQVLDDFEGKKKIMEFER